MLLQECVSPPCAQPSTGRLRCHRLVPISGTAASAKHCVTFRRLPFLGSDSVPKTGTVFLAKPLKINGAAIQRWLHHMLFNYITRVCQLRRHVSPFSQRSPRPSKRFLLIETITGSPELSDALGYEFRLHICFYIIVSWRLYPGRGNKLRRPARKILEGATIKF